MLQLRIQGRGGQGAQMAGEVLATTYFREGKFVQAYSTYGGARRGTPVATFIRVDADPIRERCDIEEPDAIVCFDPSLLSPALMSGIGPETVILINSTRPPESFADMGDFRFATLDALAVAQHNGVGRFVNSAILGAFARVMGSPDLEVLAEVVREVSPAKSEENVLCVRDGFRLVRVKGEEAITGADVTAGGGRVNATPKEIPTAWTTGYTDIFNTGTWRAATPVHEWRPSPCHVSCPIDNAIPQWIRLIGEGAYEEAWLSLVETNPFPAVTGRVCHHPCEGDCNRAILEGPVGINGLEHFLGDQALQQGWALPAAGKPLGRGVAVVGGGPAGLSCAYHLRRLGYDVTVIEARPKLGGLLRYGIPEYRLAAEVVDTEIQRIVDLGVHVRTDTPVDGVEAFARLRHEYDAVFIAVGAQRAKRLGHLDEAGGAARVLDGLDYLRRVSDGEDLALGERVVVIGGGSAAIDVARTARRQGKQVTVMSLETRDVMPAQHEEVSEAVEEGVRLVDGAMASGATLSVECLTLECRLVTLDPEAPPGVLRPLPIEGTDFLLEADAVIMAIGQDADLAAFGPALQTEQALLKVDPDTLATSLEGVFAGGDAATMSRYVSVAVGEGRRAAWGIAAYLGHPAAQPLPHLDLSQAVTANEVNTYYFPPAERTEKERTAAEGRLDDFREVALAYTTAQAA